MELISEERIKEIFLVHYTQQYGEEAARQLLEQLPDCNYAKSVAQAQLNKVLNDKDVVMVDSDQTFTESPYQSVGEGVNMGYVYARQDLRKTGWKRVIPLAEKEVEGE